MIDGVRENFQFFKQLTWFLQNRALSEFLLSIKLNFALTTRSCLVKLKAFSE